MKSRIDLSQNFLGFQNWIEDHVGPDFNISDNQEQHSEEEDYNFK